MCLSNRKMIQLFFEQSIYECKIGDLQMSIFKANETIYETLDCWMKNMCLVTITFLMRPSETVCFDLHNKCIHLKAMFQVGWLTLFSWRKILQMNIGMKWFICWNEKKSQERFSSIMRKRWTHWNRFFDVCMWSYAVT